jgi:hypothetical protein
MLIYPFSSKTVRAGMVSGAIICCLFITIYSSITATIAYSQTDVIYFKNISYNDLTSGIYRSYHNKTYIYTNSTCNVLTFFGLKTLNVLQFLISKDTISVN